MKRCFIVGAGSIFEGDLPFQKGAADLIIAADGGLIALQKAGMTPDLLIGDFDSMSNPNLPVETVVLPVEKDDTDMVYGVKEGFARGYTQFVLYGGLGGNRISHTFANLQLLAYIKNRGGHGLLVGGDTRVMLLKNESHTFPAHQKGHASFLAYGGEATLSLDGFYYPLTRGTITPDFPLGVSNHFVGQKSTVTVHDGTVVAVIEK